MTETLQIAAWAGGVAAVGLPTLVFGLLIHLLIAGTARAGRLEARETGRPWAGVMLARIPTDPRVTRFEAREAARHRTSLSSRKDG